MDAFSYEPNADRELAQAALLALVHKTGLSGKLLATEENGGARTAPDALIEFALEDRTYRYMGECKSDVDRKSLVRQVREQTSDLAEPGLLIAPYISREIAEYCREIEMQFIDTHGNAYLNRAGIYIYVAGEKSSTGHSPSRRVKGVTNAAALRITFALLCRPDMVQAPYREIAQSACVSLGAISGTFDDLKRRGLLLDSDVPRGRKLLDMKRLFVEWATNYPVALRPKLNPLRFTAADPDWWRHEHPDSYGAVWGGEVAAERISQYLKPATQTLYVASSTMGKSLKHLVTTHRLRPDPQGKIEILEKFWNFSLDQAPDIAPPILVYADLIATLEPRNSETAVIIREKLIEPAFHSS